MKKTLQLHTSFLLTFLFVSGIVMNNLQAQPTQEAKDNIQKLATTFQYIDMAYVDSVDMNELVQNSIIETLHDLDPHSVYISKEDVEKANEPLEGSFTGIGVSFQLFKDTILVISPTPDGPSDRLGIMAGDKIVIIDGENATGEEIDNQWVFDHLRGPKGSKVDVSILRKNRKELIEYTITRDKIPLNSIDASFMAADQIGYIRLDRFSRTSMDEFRDALKNLKKEGMKEMILDLRGNSGGYLGVAVDLADEFLNFGNLIVYTDGRTSPRQDFEATLLGGWKEGKLVILINEGSASASEIVSGAVQDWDRGIIIGRRSFGKGLVQRPFPLPDGSIIRLTTARYYTPTGRCIQRPYENGIEEYYMEFSNRLKSGELTHADSIHFPDSLIYQTNKGRTVYGGGGIMPDVFVPWDSTWYSDYYADVRRKGLLNQFTVDYVDKNREELKSKYTDPDQFLNSFVINGEILEEFYALSEKEGVEFDEAGWESSGLTIMTQLKALIARNMWDIGAYYKIMMSIDEEYKKAIEILGEYDTYMSLME